MISPKSIRADVRSCPTILAARSGVAFESRRGERLEVIDAEGEQVADLVAFNRDDVAEAISSARSADFASKTCLTTGDPIHSQRSRVMLGTIRDTVSRHDFLLSPCPAEMCRILHGDGSPHRGCFGNPTAAMAPYDIAGDAIPTALSHRR